MSIIKQFPLRPNQSNEVIWTKKQMEEYLGMMEQKKKLFTQQHATARNRKAECDCHELKMKLMQELNRQIASSNLSGRKKKLQDKRVLINCGHCMHWK